MKHDYLWGASRISSPCLWWPIKFEKLSAAPGVAWTGIQVDIPPVSLDQAEFTQQVPQLNHLFLVCLTEKKKNKIKEMREKEIPGKVNISENDGCLLFRFNFIWTIWVGYSRAARWLNMPSECGQCLGHALCSRHPKNYSWPSFSLPITAGCPYITFSHWPVTDS